MSNHLKVLWSEGLFLRPQHFQSQDSYHEARLQAARRDLHPYAWGLRQAGLDDDALANGVLRVETVTAVFPDGEQYRAPSADLLPDAISLESMPQDSTRMLVYIALPRMRGQGGNLRDPGEGEPADVRYAQTERQINDQFTDADEVDVFFLSKQARLLTEHDQRAEFVCIPIVRVERAATGGYALDTSFLPPVVSIEASPWLHRQLRLLLDALQAKIDALYGHHRESDDGLLEFRQKDVASFWLLHTATTSFAQMLHLLHHPGLHPERLFQAMLQLAGSLMSFSRTQSLADLPIYGHESPEAGFRKLIMMIRQMLETVVAESYLSVPLTETRPCFHAGQLDSEQIGPESQFYLSVSADMPATALVELVPQRFKLGAPDDVEACVLSALPAVPLSHLARAPSAIPSRPGRQYFLLENRGPLYERMCKARAVTVYVPRGLEQLDIEFLVVTA